MCVCSTRDLVLLPSIGPDGLTRTYQANIHVHTRTRHTYTGRRGTVVYTTNTREQTSHTETLVAHGIQWQAVGSLSRARGLPLAGSPRAQLEHAVTEASSTCFLEIDTLPSHGRHAHHRRPRQPSESRSSPVDDPSCSSSSSLSCSLLLSSTSSSLPSVLWSCPSVTAWFPLSCYELSNDKQKFSPTYVYRLLFLFFFLFFFLYPIIYVYWHSGHFYSSSGVCPCIKIYSFVRFIWRFVRCFSRSTSGTEDFTGGREDRIVNDTAIRR